MLERENRKENDLNISFKIDEAKSDGQLEFKDRFREALDNDDFHVVDPEHAYIVLGKKFEGNIFAYLSTDDLEEAREEVRLAYENDIYQSALLEDNGLDYDNLPIAYFIVDANAQLVPLIPHEDIK